jgi:hypothetical protein
MFSQEKPGDHEARQDEEHVHPDESASESGYISVKENNQHDGDGPQTLHVGSELPIAGCSSSLIA